MRALVSLCVRRFGAVTALTLVALILGVLGRTRIAARCLSGVRSLAGRHPDRGTRILAAAGGRARHQTGRECRQRRLGPRDHALGIHSGALRGHHHICRWGRCAHRAPGNIGAIVRAREQLADGCRRAETLAAGVEHDGSAEDRPAVRHGRCLRVARHGRLGHQAASARRTRRCARHRVRRQRATDPVQPDMRRLASFGITLTDVADAAQCRSAAAGRRVHRHRQPARAAAIPDSGARHRVARRCDRRGAQ